VSENLMERNRASGNDVTPEGEEDDDDDETVITVTEAANIARSLRRFVMTRKDFRTVCWRAVKFSKNLPRNHC
jgi:hypothetical protein